MTQFEHFEPGSVTIERYNKTILAELYKDATDVLQDKAEISSVLSDDEGSELLKLSAGELGGIEISLTPTDAQAAAPRAYQIDIPTQSPQQAAPRFAYAREGEWFEADPTDPTMAPLVRDAQAIVFRLGYATRRQ